MAGRAYLNMGTKLQLPEDEAEADVAEDDNAAIVSGGGCSSCRRRSPLASSLHKHVNKFSMQSNVRVLLI